MTLDHDSITLQHEVRPLGMMVPHQHTQGVNRPAPRAYAKQLVQLSENFCFSYWQGHSRLATAAASDDTREAPQLLCRWREGGMLVTRTTSCPGEGDDALLQ